MVLWEKFLLAEDFDTVPIKLVTPHSPQKKKNDLGL